MDATGTSGLAFVHDASRSAEKHLPETLGGGLALLDVDRDGDLDVLFVQSGPVARASTQPPPPHEVWLNVGGLHFERAQLLANPALGMGACAGDVDGDGDVDVAITALGPDALHLAEGGRLAEAGLALPGEDAWTTSCTFLDVEGDGDLDLFAAGYVVIDVERPPFCGEPARGRRSYCHPERYPAERDFLWINDGAGRFVEDAAARGLESVGTGKGLGVLAWDPDADGDVDLFVANDATPNHYWLNDGTGRFVEGALAAGLAYDAHGKAEACMGIACADLTGDGRDDLVVTNLDGEGNALYVAQPSVRPTFVDASEPLGLHETSLPMLGFGIDVLDADDDGDHDLLVANGHVMDDVHLTQGTRSHAQRVQLLLGDGHGRFVDCRAGCWLEPPPSVVGRGLVTGDLDGDGDLDAIVGVNGGPPVVLRNDAPPRDRLVLLLRGTASDTQAIGARVTARRRDGSTAWNRTVHGSRSYLSQGSFALHAVAEPLGAFVEVRWPSGLVETWRNLGPGHFVLVEGRSGEACPRF